MSEDKKEEQNKQLTKSVEDTQTQTGQPDITTGTSDVTQEADDTVESSEPSSELPKRDDTPVETPSDKPEGNGEDPEGETDKKADDIVTSTDVAESQKAVPDTNADIEVTSTTPIPMPSHRNEPKHETQEHKPPRKHDPLTLGLSIGGLIVGIVAFCIACAGNTYVLNVEKKVNDLQEQVNVLSQHETTNDITRLLDGLGNGIRHGIIDDGENTNVNDGENTNGGKSNQNTTDTNENESDSDTKSGKGFIGVRIKDATNGALVVTIDIGAPAHLAGIRTGDVITAVGGTSIADADALTETIQALTPGTDTTITFIRDGKTQTVDVTIGDMSDAIRLETQEG